VHSHGRCYGNAQETGMSEIRFFEKALRDIASFLDTNDIPYMVVGGLANAQWGHPRATLDIDITIWVSDFNAENVLSTFQSSYIVLVEHPLQFILETRVLPIKTRENHRIDIIFGALPFEHSAIERAVIVEVNDTPVRFCSAEDLILMKIISERTKDAEDVQGIIRYQKESLDYGYLEPRIAELASLLERSDIMEQWKKWTR